MNSEELEQSLRSEFEDYLKSVREEMQQETADFRNKIQAEFDKHRSQIDEAFEAFSARFGSEIEFDEAFRGSVAEHLRLARDEGARITADAMAEAEKMREESTPKPAYDRIRDAVNDIATKDSQSTILKSLVQHAAEFAPRGAFFIVKSEHFMGWKVFGTDDEELETAVREIHFSMSEDSILASAVNKVATIEASAGDHSGDSVFLEPLNFGSPDKMYAIPLVARGRAVAVLYADRGQNDADVNIEALETIVRVAALTVELLASSQPVVEEKPQVISEPQAETTEPAAEYSPEPAYEEAPAPSFHHFAEFEKADEAPAYTPETHQADFPPAGFTFKASEPEAETPAASSPFSFDAPESATYAERAEESAKTSDYGYGNEETRSVEEPNLPETPWFAPRTSPAAEESPAWESPAEAEAPQPSMDYSFREAEEAPEPPKVEAPSYTPAPVEGFQPPAPEFKPEPEPEAPAQVPPFSFDDRPSQPPVSAPSPFERPVGEYEPAGAVSGTTSFGKEIEPVGEVPVVQPRPRYSDRPVDLPIDVPEEERRIHNDARRFARLLVSEIKLYNEKKVMEGRQSHDLYDRLKEAIDRSREMYDKRVQPPVAAKFDYFHYELVNSLADGNVERLGSGYPGATV